MREVEALHEQHMREVAALHKQHAEQVAVLRAEIAQLRAHDVDEPGDSAIETCGHSDAEQDEMEEPKAAKEKVR